MGNENNFMRILVPVGVVGQFGCDSSSSYESELEVCPTEGLGYVRDADTRVRRGYTSTVYAVIRKNSTGHSQ